MIKCDNIIIIFCVILIVLIFNKVVTLVLQSYFNYASLLSKTSNYKERSYIRSELVRKFGQF